MSLVGVSSYGLVTKKGRTFIPFVRGTGFLASFTQTSFYTRHVITADHVCRPQRYGKLYGNGIELSKMRDRHVSCRLHGFAPNGNRYLVMPLEFKLHPCPRTDVCVLRIEREKEILQDMRANGLPELEPFEMDHEALAQDEPIEVRGLHMLNEDTLADTVSMVPRVIEGKLAAKYVSEDFGTVLVASGVSGGAVTPGMHGSPVLRKSNGKVIGVLIGGITRQPIAAEPAPRLLGTPPKEGEQHPPDVVAELHEWRLRNMHAPTVDISSNGDLMNAVNDDGFAFVPVGEFLSFMRRTEVTM